MIPSPSEEPLTPRSQPAAAAAAGRRTLPKPLTLIVLLAGAVGLIVETTMIKKVNILTDSFTTVSSSQCHNDSTKEEQSHHIVRQDRNATGYFRPDKIFGHLHYAKTAGTDVNGQLATRYERICGHKGYSYDSFQFNKRLEVKAASQQTPLDLDAGGPDIVSRYQKDYNRGRVPFIIMKEIGFEDCDYISIERPWYEWIYIAKIWPVELHVPCREPLEHLMSQCNFIHHRFDCNAPDLSKEVRQCFVHANRFHARLTGVKNLTMKCFNAAPVEPYLEYMDQFLQRKRMETPYVHRTTNDHRNRDKECLWKNQTLADMVLEILLQHDYYKWCHQCIGSTDDLLLHDSLL